MAQKRRRRAADEERGLGPTPERIAKAGEAFEVGHQGTITLRDSPLEWLERRKEISTTLYNVGSKYRHHWHFAGLLPNVGSIDLNRIFGTSGGNVGMPSTENQAHHRQQYRNAQTILGPRMGKVLDDVICHEIKLEEAGKYVQFEAEHMKRFSHPMQSRTAALVFLIEGLERLRIEWGMA
jgi:hypothetical protein